MYCMGSRLGSTGRDNNGVLHRTVLFQLARYVGDRRSLLADGDVDTFDAGTLLVDDGIDSHRRFTCLAVADNQFALTTADRHHGIDRFQARLHRLADRLALNHTRCDFLDRRAQPGVDRALAIDWVAECIDHTTKQLLADRHFENTTGTARLATLRQVSVIAEYHRTD